TPGRMSDVMGSNESVTYTIVQAGEFTWQESLAMVFVSGLIFVVIAFTPLEKVITSSIPNALKEAITIGIGILLILIGLENAGIVTTSEHTLITIGDISNPTVLITFVGLIITILLFIKNVPGNLLLSIGVTTLLTICLGETPVEGISLSMPNISEYLHVFGQIS